MKKPIRPILMAALLVAACHSGNEIPSRDELSATIDSLEQPIMQSPNYTPIDTAKGQQLIDNYLLFADTYTDDSLAPAYLQRAAQIAGALDHIDLMATYYDRVIDNYPNYAHLDECYYEKGLALDNAGRKDEARQAYQAFLNEYPSHFLADDIRRALSLLDLSDELLLQYLEEANKTGK